MIALPPRFRIPASVSMIVRPPVRARARNLGKSTVHPIRSSARNDDDYLDKFARASTASECTCGPENAGEEK